MKTKHTPGPWFNNGDFVQAKDNEEICQMFSTYQQSFKNREANAQLIATAPELLEALNYAIRFIRRCPLINEDQYPKGLENWELLIKKATE